jgi:hypothetical protein
MRLEDEAHWVGSRWRSRDDGPWWYVSFLMVEIEGRLECVGMDIRPAEDDAPMPLRAGTVRELPFASVLTMARREQAESLAGRAKWWRTLPAPGEKVAADSTAGAKVVVDPDDARILALIDERMAALMNPPEHKVGRHARYTRADLEDVAMHYRRAFARGSSSPTKDVATELGLSRDTVAKLVMRCRDPKIGLLGPTEKRKPGGVVSPGNEPHLKGSN